MRSNAFRKLVQTSVSDLFRTISRHLKAERLQFHGRKCSAWLVTIIKRFSTKNTNQINKFAPSFPSFEEFQWKNLRKTFPPEKKFLQREIRAQCAGAPESQLIEARHVSFQRQQSFFVRSGCVRTPFANQLFKRVLIEFSWAEN